MLKPHGIFTLLTLLNFGIQDAGLLTYREDENEISFFYFAFFIELLCPRYF